MTPLEEFIASLDETKSNLEFFSKATRLRPRLGDVVYWEAGADALDLARKFMDSNVSRTEIVFGGLLVHMLGALERYFRKLIELAIVNHSSKVKKFEHLPEDLRRGNVRLSGRLLASIDEPRDHLPIDFTSIVDNLATCTPGRTDFRLNLQAFTALVVGSGPTTLDKVLDHIHIDTKWDAIGENVSLAEFLGTKGARATGVCAKDRLRELWRWRNQFAHGSDKDISISESQVRDTLDFLVSFSQALDAAVHSRLKRGAA